MFKTFRALVESLGGLRHAIVAASRSLVEVAERREEHAPADARLEELERSRAKWEAEMEALLLKADGKMKAANNAEARTRTMAKHYEAEADPFTYDSEEIEAPVREGYAPTSEENGLLPLHVDLEETGKSRAMRAKYGG